MSNPLTGAVPLIIEDGREFTLVLDFEALLEAETAYGQPLPKLMSDSVVGFVTALRALLYGALRAHHRAVSFREAGAILKANGDAVRDAITAAAMAGFPDAEDGDGTNPPRRRSGASGAKPGSIPRRSGG